MVLITSVEVVEMVVDMNLKDLMVVKVLSSLDIQLPTNSAIISKN